MRVIGADGTASGAQGGLSGGLKSADIWMSHEALLLEYEEALTRKMKIPGFAKIDGDDEEGFYCTSALVTFSWSFCIATKLIFEFAVTSFGETAIFPLACSMLRSM